MRFIICGAGQVGWQIARHLASEHGDVTIIDSNPELVRRASETLDVAGITGFASYPDVLKEAGAADADMIIAATYSDEVNMVICQVAHSIFSVPRKIARLRAQSYLDAIYSDLYRRDHLPIDIVISPEREVARAAIDRLNSPATFDVASFLDGDAQLAGIVLSPDCPVLDTPLRQLTELFSTLRAMVVGVRRGARLYAPEPGDQLQVGDHVYLFAPLAEMARTLEVFGKTAKRCERVILIGGGNVGLTVARALEAGPQRIRAKVVEANLKQAEKAADALERTIVLNGDGLSMDMLEEAGIDRADALLALTDDDKTNLLVAARAKAAGCPMAISLINDPGLASLMGPLNIDAFIDPRATTVSSILRHVRLGRVRTVYSIGDAEAEVIEAQVLSTSPLAGQYIRDVDFPEGALVAGLRKQGGMVRPTGSTRIEEGDLIVLFVLRGDVAEVDKLLHVGIDFF